MAFTEFSDLQDTGSKKIVILIFAEGTILKPKSWFRLYDHQAYTPIGRCVQIIAGWCEQGAEIVYCTSRKKGLADIRRLLTEFGFAGSGVYYRGNGERYKDIVEGLRPDILIEDNCRSIGGAWQMCISKVDPDVKAKIKSIVVKEFGGIDFLPVMLSDLLLF